MTRKLISLTTVTFAFFFYTGIGIGQAQNFIKGFSLKLTGGYGTMATGDYNTIGKDFEQNFNDYRSIYEMWYGTSVSRIEEFKKINMGVEFEGELTMDLGGTFRIGIGVGYIKRSKENEYGLSITGLGNESVFMDPIITVVPVKLSLYFFPPVASSLNIYLCGGLGYYTGKIKNTFRRSYIRYDEGLGVFYQYWENSESELKDNALGFHGGAGLEFKLMPKIIFFMEGMARYCKLKDWKGDGNFSDSDGWTYSISGTMWYFEVKDNNWYSMFELYESIPTWYDMRNGRKFEVNLAGISLRTGIRIKF